MPLTRKQQDVINTLIDTAPPAQTFPEGVYGNIYIRPMLFGEIGSRMGGHAHSFDHVTMLWRGTVQMKAVLSDDKVVERVYKAPAFVTIKANVKHEFTALEADSLAFCIYAHRDPIDGEVVQHFNGWMEAFS